MRVCSKKQKQKPRHTKVSLRENTQRSHLNIYHIPPDFCGLFLITGAGTTGVKFVTFGKSIEKKNNKKQQVWCFEYKRVNSCSFTVVFPRGFYNLAGQRKKKHLEDVLNTSETNLRYFIGPHSSNTFMNSFLSMKMGERWVRDCG